MDMTTLIEKAKNGELTFGDVKEMLTEVASYYDAYDDDKLVGPLMDVSSMSGTDIQNLINQSGRIGLLLPTELA